MNSVHTSCASIRSQFPSFRLFAFLHTQKRKRQKEKVRFPDVIWAFWEVKGDPATSMQTKVSKLREVTVLPGSAESAETRAESRNLPRKETTQGRQGGSKGGKITKALQRRLIHQLPQTFSETPGSKGWDAYKPGSATFLRLSANPKKRPWRLSADPRITDGSGQVQSATCSCRPPLFPHSWSLTCLRPSSRHWNPTSTPALLLCARQRAIRAPFHCDKVQEAPPHLPAPIR